MILLLQVPNYFTDEQVDDFQAGLCVAQVDNYILIREVDSMAVDYCYYKSLYHEFDDHPIVVLFIGVGFGESQAYAIEFTKDSYNILVENNRVYKLGGWEFLDIANKLFDNEKQVDWGSYAYQCTKEQLEKLMEQTGCEIDKMNELASEKIYGIVFVEEV